jgi:hypothetical protein
MAPIVTQTAFIALSSAGFFHEPAAMSAEGIYKFETSIEISD